MFLETHDGVVAAFYEERGGGKTENFQPTIVGNGKILWQFAERDGSIVAAITTKRGGKLEDVLGTDKGKEIIDIRFVVRSFEKPPDLYDLTTHTPRQTLGTRSGIRSGIGADDLLEKPVSAKITIVVHLVATKQTWQQTQQEHGNYAESAMEYLMFK